MNEKSKYENHLDRRIDEMRRRYLKFGPNPGALQFRQWKAKREENIKED